MPNIADIRSREILDSRGIPTIETSVILSDGNVGTSSVPSGLSRGAGEAFELRDQDEKRYEGMGVLKAISNVRSIIAPKVLGMSVFEQQKIDQSMIELDGSENKGNLGANAILSVSQAVARAGAKSASIPLFSYVKQLINTETPGGKIPTPMFNLIEGGKHGGQTLDFQEFLVIPATSKSYSEDLTIGVSVYRSLGKLLFERGETTLVAEEGGFSPNLTSNQNAITLVKDAVEKSGLSFSLDVFVGLDVAANSFIQGKLYRLTDRAVPYNSDELLDFYKTLISDFSLIYIEDPYGEEDWDAWKKFYAACREKTLIAGDDLTTTNPYRLELAITNNAIGGVIIKPNQIGTVTEAIAVSEIARFKGIKTIVSHRGGETMDSFIADFAVGISADYVKFGAPARERVAKYNRLLSIEEDLR